MAGPSKRLVSFMLTAEELRWLVRHLEIEPLALGYAPIVDTLIAAKERLVGDRVDVQMPADEATVLHEWVFAWSSYVIATRIRRAIGSSDEPPRRPPRRRPGAGGR
jgi:hypothetical protein